HYVLYRRDKVFLGGSLHDIKLSAASRPDPSDDSDTIALQIENFKAHRFVMIILAGLQRMKRGFIDVENGPNAFLRRVDCVDIAEFNQKLPPMGCACFELIGRAMPLFL